MSDSLENIRINSFDFQITDGFRKVEHGSEKWPQICQENFRT